TAEHVPVTEAEHGGEVDGKDAQGKGGTDRMRKLLDILAEKMAVLRNRESFAAFTDDVMDAMGVLPPGTAPEDAPKPRSRKADLQRLEARIRNTQAMPVVPQAVAADVPFLGEEGQLPDKLLVAL